MCRWSLKKVSLPDVGNVRRFISFPQLLKHLYRKSAQSIEFMFIYENYRPDMFRLVFSKANPGRGTNVEVGLIKD